MLKLAISIGTALGVLCATHVAQAHWLECTKFVNGEKYLEITDYPITLTYDFTIINKLPDEQSCVEDAYDESLESYGNFVFDNPAPPFCLDGGMTASDSFVVELQDYEDCLELAAADGVADERLDNVFFVEWESGYNLCVASIVCMPPEQEGGPSCTPGYFKTHEDALTQCLAEGAIQLGPLTIDTLVEALGLLWGSPATYDNGTKRSEYDQVFFLLARHTLVAECNTRLFGTETDPANLIDLAMAALSDATPDCSYMHELQGMLDDFNNEGDDCPGGLGPATPTHAQSIADDPTSPTNLQCE